MSYPQPELVTRLSTSFRKVVGPATQNLGMEIRLTLLDLQRLGARVDVVIDAPVGALFSTVSDQLMAALEASPAVPNRHFHCAQEPVHGSQPLGLPPLLQGSVLTLATDQVRTLSAPPRPLLEVHVIAGPDAGIVVPLTLGRHRIGRGPGQLVRLTDPEASRTHAELAVDATQIELRDVGSTNGTRLAERRLGSAPETLQPEDQVRIGTGVICIRRPDRPPAAGTMDGAGHLQINRAPNLRPPRAQLEIIFPAEPSDPSPARLPWLAMLLPLLIAVPLALFWKQPTFLLFALMTPVLMAGQYLADRRNRRHDKAARLARHQALCTRRQHDLERAIAADVRHLEATRPDLARLTVTADLPTDEIWRRSINDPDFLVLRLGRGPELSPIMVRRPTSEDLGGGLGLETTPFMHPEVPIAVDLAATGILGICGPRRSVLGLARSLIGQISVLHSPQEVRIQVVTADPSQRRDWLWTTWLPHHDASRSSPTSGVGPGDRSPRRILVLDGAHVLRRRPELAAVLNRAAKPPDHSSDRTFAPLILCLDQTERDLPVECGALAAVAETRAVLRRAGAAAAPFVPDLASERWAERLARDLAPLRDGTPEPGQELPAAVRLFDLLTGSERVRPTDPDDLARHWRRCANLGPSATIGVTASGPFRIDLQRDGPHLLIGGTTGSGKSELLQTLVAALAIESGPDTLSFLLVDYKGGSAFRECAELPHVGGLITDLDPALAQRALASLTAELRRRERLLRSVPASDIDSYRAARSTRADLPVLPRLVVIVDEFRVLAEDLPEFVSGLVRTATVGRSLGVHLVLATQRPSGIVSTEITANVNLRIALRVNDSGDSRDLIDDQAAAGLPVERPGRALARIAGGPLIGFQTAVVSGLSPTVVERSPVVRRLDLALVLEGDPGSDTEDDVGGDTRDDTESDSDRRTGRAVPEPVPGPNAPSDLTMIAQAARVAAERLDLAPVQPPWVAPLPQRIGLDLLLASTPSSAPPVAGGPRKRLQVPFALMDLPAQQCQEVLLWQLDGSHLAVSGGPRSGRTTTVHSIARALSAVTEPGEAHVYVVDGAGGLVSLRFLPPVEAVIPVHDLERAERLLRLLSSEIDVRQGDEAAGPGILLLIDGWEALTSTWGVVDHGRLIDQLTTVLRDGPAVGIHAVISGGRTLLTGAISTLLTERVVLRFADPADAIMAGVPSSRIRGTQPTGRGLVLGPRFAEPVEIQVAVAEPIDPALAEAEDAFGGSAPAAVSRPSQITRPPAGNRNWRIPELPRRLEHSRLIAAWCAEESASGALPDPGRRVPIGIGGDEALPLGLDLDAAPVTLVAGPAGSGRTGALRCIADGLSRLGEPVLWVSLTGCAGTSARHLTAWGRDAHGFQVVDGSKPGAVTTLRAALAARPASTVLVDDTQQTGTPGSAQDGLDDLLTTRIGVAPLVVASSPSELLGAYRGLLAVTRMARSGLLLGPVGPGEAEVFGLRPERRPPAPPGRALLIQGTHAVSVQLALPPPLERPPPGRVAVNPIAPRADPIDPRG